MALNKLNSAGDIARLLDSTPHLPALPVAVFEVIRLAGDFNSSTTQIANAVSKDQSLSGRVLQLANSAYYGLAREVAAVVDAIGLLGKASVRNLALLATSRRWYESEDMHKQTALKPLWNHAVACAVASQTLADSVYPAQSEEAFCAGLLHNVGKVVLSVSVPDRMAKVTIAALKTNLTVSEVEKRVFGFDHAEVGYELCKRWDLPDRILNPILYHHRPGECPNDRHLTDIVHVADRLCAVLGTAPGTDHFLSPVDHDAFKRLGLKTMADTDKILCAITERTLAATPFL